MTFNLLCPLCLSEQRQSCEINIAVFLIFLDEKPGAQKAKLFTTFQQPIGPEADPLSGLWTKLSNFYTVSWSPKVETEISSHICTALGLIYQGSFLAQTHSCVCVPASQALASDDFAKNASLQQAIFTQFSFVVAVVVLLLGIELRTCAAKQEFVPLS